MGLMETSKLLVQMEAWSRGRGGRRPKCGQRGRTGADGNSSTYRCAQTLRAHFLPGEWVYEKQSVPAVERGWRQEGRTHRHSGDGPSTGWGVSSQRRGLRQVRDGRRLNRRTSDLAGLGWGGREAV